MCCGLWWCLLWRQSNFGGNKKSESPRSESPRSESPKKLSQHRKFKKYQGGIGLINCRFFIANVAATECKQAKMQAFSDYSSVV